MIEQVTPQQIANQIAVLDEKIAVRELGGVIPRDAAWLKRIVMNLEAVKEDFEQFLQTSPMVSALEVERKQLNAERAKLAPQVKAAHAEHEKAVAIWKEDPTSTRHRDQWQQAKREDQKINGRLQIIDDRLRQISSVIGKEESNAEIGVEDSKKSSRKKSAKKNSE